jgi:NAD-dependent DNA ligase
MSPSAELRDLLALHLTPGVGPRLADALLERFGSPAAVLRASEAQLRDVPHIGPKLAQYLTRAAGNPEIEVELERIAKSQVRLLVKGTPDYPESIASIPDPPLLLYVRGALTPADAGAVALVGSRQCTDYGRTTAGACLPTQKPRWYRVGGACRLLAVKLPYLSLPRKISFRGVCPLPTTDGAPRRSWPPAWPAPAPR